MIGDRQEKESVIIMERFLQGTGIGGKLIRDKKWAHS
jgi:hypothetical protein